jgi:hypothetical protein
VQRAPATLPTVSDATLSPGKNAGAFCILVRQLRRIATLGQSFRPTLRLTRPPIERFAALDQVHEESGACRVRKVGVAKVAESLVELILLGPEEQGAISWPKPFVASVRCSSKRAAPSKAAVRLM